MKRIHGYAVNFIPKSYSFETILQAVQQQLYVHEDRTAAILSRGAKGSQGGASHDSTRTRLIVSKITGKSVFQRVIYYLQTSSYRALQYTLKSLLPLVRTRVR